MRNEIEASPASLSSVSNALRVLSLLQGNPALRVVDVSRALGTAASTAHRLMTCLKNEGYLRQPTNARHYVAGPELLRLARHFSDQNTLERVAHPHLERLCKGVNEAVNLQILVGSEVLCIDSVVEDRHTLQVRPITGRRASPRISAAGKLLLSGLRPTELDDVLNHGESNENDRDPVEDARLHAELAIIRDLGYATNMGEREAGVHAVAVAVNDQHAQAIAAISVAAPSVRLPHIRIGGLVHQLQEASAAITFDYCGKPSLGTE